MEIVPNKRLLIAGGNGVTGQLILQYLFKFDLQITIDIAARKASQAKHLPKEVGRIDINLKNADMARELFQHYDIILLAIGPFDLFKASLHNICAELGKVCIDINDSYQATTEIIKLNAKANANGSTILTGMGLAPGLTTLLLKEANQVQGEFKRGGVRIFFSDGLTSGKASIYTMLYNFIPEVFILANGKPKKVRSKTLEKHSAYSFNESLSNKSLIYYSSPEIQTLPLWNDYQTMEQLDFAFHLEGLPMSFVPFLRHLRWFRKPLLNYMTTAIYNKQNKRISHMGVQTTKVIAIAFTDDNEHIVKCSVSSNSSYELTAMMAALITESVVRGEISLIGGVHSAESPIIPHQYLKQRFAEEGNAFVLTQINNLNNKN